ncbi:hypothetical protein BU24DRAFT_441792 [Aaosphaeria arxii CBS 175.79]|uniref:Uncharacterized protein n=1 Tax=Aaosphaeria arxii CBS 175.79 TaxID=1450172 RepID=A0A6A5XPA0_9PLEO|nr:uncharacterized protein BU24DRAFT_441792 [Aaosphaeria arxii CBS 175.79]KAF2014174.1 hypothetical protein BU24DRAFT_441792 [Aaosphaeria arxii CBS 175.79]
MDDAVRLSAEGFRSIYESGFKTWARLHANVEGRSGLPASSFATQGICQHHPALSRKIRLEDYQLGVITTGESIWGSCGAKCTYAMPLFRQSVSIQVGVKEPVSLSISKSTERQHTLLSCFIRNQDYLAILVIAWAYILSARWTEIIPGNCSLTYTESQATTHQDTTQRQDEGNLVSVELGDVNPQEARRWAASIQLQKSFGFLLLHPLKSMSSICSAATFSGATHYLNRFCARHNVFDQSQAALASVLLLPSMGSMGSLRLPAPSSSMGVSQITPASLGEDSNDDCIHRSHQLDKLLTLSCNMGGMRPLLLSVFYEPNIECNAVTPWLQGSLAAIKQVAGNNSYVIGRLCMERSPKVAFLWLGCIILDLQDKLLQDVHYGQILVDLHSAAWSGVVQSFIQERVSNPLVTNGTISRADECRLLFLSQSDRHVRLPVCKWKPFGRTELDNVDIEVRAHQQCDDHWLQYEGIDWKCDDGSLDFLSSQNSGSQQTFGETSIQETRDECATSISYKEMVRDQEHISENATRNICGWLRSDVYAQGEQNIWKHEWFDISDSDDDDMTEDETISDGSDRLSPRVESWLLNSNASTTISSVDEGDQISPLQAEVEQLDKSVNGIVVGSLSEHNVANLAQLLEAKESFVNP